MKLTVFLGSPRKGGNTDILAECLLAGANDAGHETEAISLRSLSIHPCIGCEHCWSNGKPCVLEDDMQSLYQTIAVSDALIFATPVYWYAPTAIMKAFIDRLVPFNRPQGRPLIEGKQAILITTYEEKDCQAVEPLLRMFELSFNYLGQRLTDCIVSGGLGPKGAVREKPDLLEAAYRIGRCLG
ncbi:MAG: flavodoxin family protein [Armatimonadota bacterium]